jgi:hypothetical protein
MENRTFESEDEILPSEEAHARMAPSSWGAHDIELTGLPIPSYQRSDMNEEERTRRGVPANAL